jgi:WD40 repeat protein
MKLHYISLIVLALFFSMLCNGQISGLNYFLNESQIGQPSLSGSYEFHSIGQKYLLQGSGNNIWFDQDQFYFLWNYIKGDFLIQARLSFLGEGMHAHRKIGLMMRENTGTSSPHFSAVVHGDGLTSLQYRLFENEETLEMKADILMPDLIQLEKRANTILFSYAKEGERFETVRYDAKNISGNYLVGLFICSHDSSSMEEAVFDNVRLTLPAPADLVPYQDFLGSHIEVLDIESGTREIIFSSSKSLQAPEWTKDGKNLIYNSEGKLFQLNLQTRTSREINTGFAIRNNNDHVLSPDGKWQGISHHAEEDNGVSMIYVLPAVGGTPEKITSNGPSYLHGWSPDGKFLTYTGGRNGNYDIYKIQIEDKKEIRLTDSPALDDGSEFSPDGKYIYFNSALTGSMQIWRMKPDGSGQEQLTFDTFNNWFPHVSPDGKSIVIISYSPEVPAEDHPFYKHVYIRIMPADGGPVKVLAALCGGQGTINVNSWSPDGKKIAFVSNTGLPEGN